jgi:hypothetical protein
MADKFVANKFRRLILIAGIEMSFISWTIDTNVRSRNCITLMAPTRLKGIVSRDGG